MTQEDKQLLIVDLCTRLSYNLIVDRLGVPRKVLAINPYNNKESLLLDRGEYMSAWCRIDDVKPYLRPMSSITDEEIRELKKLCSIYIPAVPPNIMFEDYGILVLTHHLTNDSYSFKLNMKSIDWLNAHYFDYRGLIEKGLAIAVNKNNNPYIN